jgi:hypothetical protein
MAWRATFIHCIRESSSGVWISWNRAQERGITSGGILEVNYG